MSEKPFDFLEKWDEAENRRFLETMKRKKTEFCQKYGFPIPAFDKVEDFFVTTDMIAASTGKDPRERLKPCPFCGGEAKHGCESEWGSGQYIYCTKCGCKSKVFWNHMEQNEREARDFWNTRARVDDGV